MGKSTARLLNQRLLHFKGTGTLRAIFGPQWHEIANKNWVGRKFLEEVRLGKHPGISCAGETPTHSKLYRRD